MAKNDLPKLIDIVAETGRRLLNPNPAFLLLLKRHKERQRRHWNIVKRTPFAQSTLSRPSPGRGGARPREGTFATASGLLRRKTIEGHSIEGFSMKTGPLEGDPVQHSYTSTIFEEVVAEQEKLQKEKGAGSLMYKYTAGMATADALLFVGYWFEPWGGSQQR